MPRQQQDRENLLREATALTERISLRLSGHDEEIVVGFRRDGSASIYLGGSRVYQFTCDGRLRRAYVGDLLYKAEKGHLISLTRERKANVVELTRHVLSDSQAQKFLAEMRERLEQLHDALSKKGFTLVGQVSAEGDLVDRMACWLDEFSGRVEIAESPRVG
jgi:hypothetical protein